MLCTNTRSGVFFSQAVHACLSGENIGQYFFHLQVEKKKLPTTLPFFDATEEIRCIPPGAVRNLVAIRDSCLSLPANAPATSSDA